MIEVHIRDMDSEIWREAKSYAVRMGLSMATVVGMALSAYLPELREVERKPEKKAPRKRGKAE